MRFQYPIMLDELQSCCESCTSTTRNELQWLNLTSLSSDDARDAVVLSNHVPLDSRSETSSCSTDGLASISEPSTEVESLEIGPGKYRKQHGHCSHSPSPRCHKVFRTESKQSQQYIDDCSLGQPAVVARRQHHQSAFSMECPSVTAADHTVRRVHRAPSPVESSEADQESFSVGPGNPYA